MRNREKYFTKQCEYDLMISIAKNSKKKECAIQLVSGKHPFEHTGCLRRGIGTETCESCIQTWLNQKAER